MVRACWGCLGFVSRMSVENSGAPPAQQVLVRQGSVSRLKLGLREMLLGLEEHGWSVGSAGLRGRRPGGKRGHGLGSVRSKCRRALRWALRWAFLSFVFKI